ncbi:uncharacterized protein LOC115890073 [Sitophilus oryzae]|uniref:Uncharacterized protein LOC115890073 n=1 Tax=Sitophilus oryzae TaxID=7048 RepID=A0A6J2YRW9_SITOR|nr:uncharacterized protein LOC115890073 [Sitophilus oryzae]
MALVYKLLDTIKLTGHPQTNFACGMSEDDQIFILSEAGVYIVTLKPNLNSNFAQFSCKKSFFKCSDYSLCDNVDLNFNDFFYELPREMLYESIARIELSANLIRSTPVEPHVTEAHWSGLSISGEPNCFLGILTNLYSLEIYLRTVNETNLTEYCVVLNLTKELIEIRRGHFVYSNKLPPIQKYNEFKKRIEFIAPIAFCWSHSFLSNSKSCSIIFIAHLHGFVSILRIFNLEHDETVAKYEFLGRFATNLGDISTLYWHQTSAYDGALCLGDRDGKVSIVHVADIDKNDCIFENEVEFCKEKDHSVDKITVMNFEGYTVLIAVKQCYLFFYALNENGKLIDVAVHNVNNLYITGLSHRKNKLKVLTFTGIFKHLTISVHFNKIYVVDKEIQMKLDTAGFRTHGFIESKNNVITGVLLSPYRFSNSIDSKQPDSFHIFQNTQLNPLKLLWENESESLTNHWDCLETLRMVCLKEQRFPWLGIDPDLNYDTLSLHKLKTLRLIAQMSETVFSVVKEVRSYDIKPYILIHYLVDIKLITKRLNKLFSQMNSGKKLSDFQMRSIELQLFFLKETVLNGILAKAEIGENFIKDISHVLSIGNEIEFPDMVPCQFCGEKLIGPTCVPPHADSRCCFTMHQIFVTPTHRCNNCDSVVHKEALLELTRPLCPYCDIPLQKITLASPMKKCIEELEETFEVRSECMSDCMKEKLELEDIEENDVELLVVSDDEEETVEDALKEMYFRVSKLNFENDENDTIKSENSKT